MNSLGRLMSVVIFFLFRLWSTPNLLHGKIQLSLDCGLLLGGEGTLIVTFPPN